MIMTNINPFFLSNSLFNEKTKLALKDQYNDFVHEYFYQWALFVFAGEYTSTIIYPKLKDQLIKKFSAAHPSEDMLKIEEYFRAIVHDETEHTNLLLTILNDYFNYTPTQNLFDNSAALSNEFFQKESTINSLSRYYIGECYLWIGFYKLYKETTDCKLKKMLHRLLIDETRHNHAIYNIFKNIVSKSDFDLDYFNKRVHELRYFSFPYIKTKFSLADNNSKKDIWWLSMIFDSSWHQEFNNMVIKKTYRVVNLFHPNISLSDYKLLINKSY